MAADCAGLVVGGVVELLVDGVGGVGQWVVEVGVEGASVGDGRAGFDVRDLAGVVGVEVVAFLGVVVGVRFQLVVLAEGGVPGSGCVVFYSWSVMSWPVVLSYQRRRPLWTTSWRSVPTGRV